MKTKATNGLLISIYRQFKEHFKDNLSESRHLQNLAIRAGFYQVVYDANMFTLNEIASVFGKDHGTVYWALKRNKDNYYKNIPFFFEAKIVADNILKEKVDNYIKKDIKIPEKFLDLSFKKETEFYKNENLRLLKENELLRKKIHNVSVNFIPIISSESYVARSVLTPLGYKYNLNETIDEMKNILTSVSHV